MWFVIGEAVSAKVFGYGFVGVFFFKYTKLVRIATIKNEVTNFPDILITLYFYYPLGYLINRTYSFNGIKIDVKY